MIYYVYVLRSLKDEKWYTGYTKDIDERLKFHNTGKVESTRHRGPFEIIYYEVCLHQKDALRREKYLKSGNGKIYIKSRLRYYFSDLTEKLILRDQ